MKTLLKKVKNSEFLTSGELLKLKVSLVLLFLFLFGIITIPVSIIGEFSLEVRIFLPSIFILLFLLSLAFLVTNKLRTSMHFSIYSFVGLTMYYTLGSSHLYGYLLLFITLTIIVFYQDIYTYIIYGGALVFYGVIYIQSIGNSLLGIEATSLLLSNLVYQGLLLAFYVIFLIHFILSESAYDNLNEEYLSVKKNILLYQNKALKYNEELNERYDKKEIYNQEHFKYSVKRVSEFISEIYEIDSQTIDELVEFYFFLHDKNIDEIKQSENLNPLSKKYLMQLEKYMLNQSSEMNEIIFSYAGRFQDSYHQETKIRYQYHINTLSNNKADQIILLCYMYIYFRTEPTQFDKWGRVERTLSHEEIKTLFTSNAFRDIISFSDMTFFIDNEELFKKYFS